MIQCRERWRAYTRETEPGRGGSHAKNIPPRRLCLKRGQGHKKKYPPSENKSNLGSANCRVSLNAE